MRSFVDRMFEDDEKLKHKMPSPLPATQGIAEGGEFDPTVYKLIKRKRQEHANDGTAKEFDARLQHEADKLGRKKAA